MGGKYGWVSLSVLLLITGVWSLKRCLVWLPLERAGLLDVSVLGHIVGGCRELGRVAAQLLVDHLGVQC